MKEKDFGMTEPNSGEERSLYYVKNHLGSLLNAELSGTLSLHVFVTISLKNTDTETYLTGTTQWLFVSLFHFSVNCIKY